MCCPPPAPHASRRRFGWPTSASTSTWSASTRAPSAGWRPTWWPSPTPRGWRPTPSRSACAGPAHDRLKAVVTGPRLRDDLGDLEGYHSPQVDVAVRLNTNESPYPPPPEFFAAWTGEVSQASAHRYPDRAARALREALGGFLGQPPERIFCANGSNEVLQTLLLGYGGPGRTALVFEPSYVLHAHIARITGTGVLTAPRRPDFQLDPAVATT